MEQRDLLKDQIEQLGRVLGKILSDFLGLKSKGKVTEGVVEASNARFLSELDIDIEKLLNIESSDLKKYLNSSKLTETHLEILSEYLTEAGKTNIVTSKKKTYLMKAIELLDIADETSETMSLERMNKKSKIESVLQQCV